MNEDKFHQALVNSLPDMVWAFDKDFVIRVANAAFFDMRRELYKSKLKVGDSLFQDVSEAAKNRWLPIYERVLKGERILMDDIRNIQGKETMVKLSLNPVYGDSNEVIGCMGITYDISAESQLEIQVNQFQKKIDDLEGLYQHQLQPKLAKFFAISQQLSQISNYSADDQAAMIYMINEELGQLNKNLNEFIKLMNGESDTLF
jgi:PAS domain S-box-containing protein